MMDGKDYFQVMKDWLLYGMAVLYVAAGIYHFVRPKIYVKIVPPWLPSPLMLVYISGVIEIVLGLLLLPESTRSFAAWGIILLLIAIFPANIQMLSNYRRRHHPQTWVTVLRLPLQLALIYWAWLYT